MVRVLIFCWSVLSHISTAVSRESGVFLPFTVPSSALGSAQEEMCFPSLFTVRGWGSATKPRLRGEKETSLLTRTSHVSSGFPGSSGGKESACNDGDSVVPSLGQKDPLEKEMQPTPVFLPEKSHGQSMGAQRTGDDWASHTFTFSCIPMRNEGVSNSKRRLEFRFADHFNQRTAYI